MSPTQAAAPETKSLSFTSISAWPAQLAYWDVHTHAFRVESEPVRLMIGDSSANIVLKTTIQVD